MSGPPNPYTNVGEIARRHGVKPAAVTQLFTERKIPDNSCPIISGRRLVPVDLVPRILDELKRKGVAVAAAPAEGGDR